MAMEDVRYLHRDAKRTESAGVTYTARLRAEWHAAIARALRAAAAAVGR